MHLNARDCESYYCAQVGGGDVYFRGISHQRGYGFFGDLRRYITPIALKAGRYLGRHLLHAGKNVISDVSSGEKFRDATRSRLRETTKKIKEDIFKQLQQGSGIKRKRSKKSKQS